MTQPASVPDLSPAAPLRPAASPWHVGPWVDAPAYHWSWVPPLLVLLALGPKFPTDYWPLYVLVLGMNFAHQALTVRFVYLDPTVRHGDRRRLTVLPLAMLAIFGFELFAGKTSIGRHGLSVRDLAVIPAAVLLLVQLDAVLRDDRPLRPLRAWAATVALGAAAAGLALAQGARLGVPGAVLELGGLATMAVALAVASRRRRSAGETVDARGWAAELVIPGLLVAATVAAAGWPALATGVWPAKKTKVADLLGPIAAVSYVWNFWHVYMQKYGIFRLYAGKATVDPARRVPGWVDRLFVLAWLPLTFVVLGPANAAYIAKRYDEIASAAGPLFALLAAHATALTAAGVAVVLASATAFVVHERRASERPSVPRISFAASFFLLSAALVLVDPFKVIVAFGFNHTLEYLVFVWAWQRKKHAPTDPAAARRIAVAVFGFMAVAVVTWSLTYAAGKYVAVGWHQPKWFGRTPKDAFLVLATYLAITHFYVDGFLWKLRKPEVRAVL